MEQMAACFFFFCIHIANRKKSTSKAAVKAFLGEWGMRHKVITERKRQEEGKREEHGVNCK